MVTVEYLVALIGTLLFKTASSASINYEPIKITVNENFNAQPGQVSTEPQALESGTLHQGANFYFKPQLNLPQSFIPSHIEALMSLIQQHHHSCAKDASKVVVDKDKLIEILQPLSEMSKATLLESVLEKEKNFEIVNPKGIIDKIVTEPAPVLLTEESNPDSLKYLVIPEAPVLPKHSFNAISAIIEKEMKKEDSVLLEETMGEISTIPEIAARPIMEPIVNYFEPKLIASEHVNIPEAPVLPLLSINSIPNQVEKEIKKEETLIVEGQRGVFPTIPKIAVKPIQEAIMNTAEPNSANTELKMIPEAPVLPPLSANDIKLIEDGVNINEDSANDVQSKPAIHEYAVIPEAPVLPESSFVEDMKKEISIIFKEPTELFSTIPEIAVRPIQEQFNNYNEPDSTTSELLVISEAPALPHLSRKDIHFMEKVKNEEPIDADADQKLVIQELVIPEAPTLPPLSFNSIPAFFEAKTEESVILDTKTSAVHTVPEMVEKPIKEPLINYVEPKFVISELVIIPEVPALPSLSFNDMFPNVEKEIKKEETIIVDGQRGMFPTIPEIGVRPVQEPIINFVEPKPNTEFEVIPEAPVLPPLSSKDIKLFEEGLNFDKPLVVDVEPEPINTEFQRIPEAPVLLPLSANNIKLIEDGVKINENAIVDVESKPGIQEYVVIPEAPVLPPLTLHEVSSPFVEEVKKEESIIFKEPTVVFSTIPEIVMRPIQEPINNYIDLEYTNSEDLVIPEAPELPPLSANDIKLIEEGVKFNKPIVIDVQPETVNTQSQVIPKASEQPSLSANDIKLIEDGVKTNEPIVVDVESKPINTEFQIIPEAPVLPPLSANDIKLIVEGVKLNEPIDVEPKPLNTEFQGIPEAPVLPPLSANDIKLIEDELKINEPIVVDVESKPTNTEFQGIPEAPVLAPLSANDIKLIEEGVKLNEPIDVEPKPLNTEFQGIPEAPVLPPLSDNDIKLIEDGVKLNEHIGIDVEPKPINMEFQVIPKAPELPPLSANDIKLIEEGVKFNKPIIIDVEPKSTNTEFQVIPEATILPTIADNDIKLIEDGVKINEHIGIDVEPKPINMEFQVIPEAPELPPLSANDIKLIEEGVKFNKPIVVESKPAVQEYVVIPEAPVLPPLSLHDVHSTLEEVKNEELVTLEKSTGCSSTPPKESAGSIPKPIVNYDEPKPATSKLVVIPEAPVLPPLSAKDIHVLEEAVKIEEPVSVDEPRPFISNHLVIPEAPVLPDLSTNRIPEIFEEVTIEESTTVEESMGELPSNPEISGRPFQEPIVVSESAESFALENNIFPVAKEEVKIEIPILLEETIEPVAKEEVKIEIPILLEETIELFPPIAEISSGPSQENIQVPEMTNSYVFKEMPQSNPDNVLTVKETLPPTIIPKPSNNLGVFSYAPFVSHLSNRAPNTKKLKIAKPASLERFLLKKHPFRLPVTPFPKLSLSAMKNSIWENKKQFLYPTSYAHDVVEKRIAPNMAFKKNAPPKRVKIYLRSQVPKGPSH